MLLWDEIMVKKCKDLGLILDLYKRYVDDMILVTRAVNPRWYCNEKGKMVFDPDRVEADRQVSDTERTARVFAQEANSINMNIQVTVDHPEKHPDKKMPVLDLKVWINDGQTLVHIGGNIH